MIDDDLAPEPQMPVLIPRPQGNGALLSGGVPGPRKGKYLRRETREACVLEFNRRIPKLAQIAEGRVRVLLGYTSPSEAAEHFYELQQKISNPDADRFLPWHEASDSEQKLLIDTFAVMMAAGRTHKELVADVGVKEQLTALDTLAKYGMGTTIQAVDEDGETLRGVIALPEMAMHMVQSQQAAMRARMAGESDDAEFEIVEEDADITQRTDSDVAPPPVEERINPELVEIIRRRRANGNGKKKDERQD